MSRNKSRVLRIVLFVLLALVLAAALLGLGLYMRVRSLTRGAELDFDYSVQLSESALAEYGALLDNTDLTGGRAEGKLAGGRLSARLLPGEGQAPLTEIYLDSDGLMLDAGGIYNYFRQGFLQEHPLLGQLVPEWGWGDYITRQQLNELLGQDSSLSLPPLTALRPVKFEDGLEGYIYFGLPEEENNLFLGVSPGTVLKGKSELHIVSLAGGVRTELRGTIADANVSVEKPQSVLSQDEFEIIQDLWSLLRPFLEGK